MGSRGGEGGAAASATAARWGGRHGDVVRSCGSEGRREVGGEARLGRAAASPGAEQDVVFFIARGSTIQISIKI